MKYRPLGRTGLQVSELGFGCGAIGGLMVRGDPADQVRAVARAVELGINYFDTAAIYGNGRSEENLGRVLKALRPNVLVGTKVRVPADQMSRIEQWVVESVEASLRRLQRDQVDLIQGHNPQAIRRSAARGMLSVRDVIDRVVPAFERLVAQGKARFWGLNGLGETPAIHRVVERTGAYTIQACYNLLNPTAGVPAPAGFPFQDYRQLIDVATRRQVGVIAIRILAGGALSGTATRHPVAAPTVDVIASSADYADDVRRARAFEFLVKDGYASSLVEAAIRFAISHQGVSTALVGFSSLEQLEAAVQSVARGPLPAQALARLNDVWSRLGGT